MLAYEIHDAPAPVALLDMLESKRRYLGSPKTTAEKNGDDSAIAQPFQSAGVGRVQETLCLAYRKPVAGSYAHGLRALHAGDARRQLGRDQPIVGGLRGQLPNR